MVNRESGLMELELYGRNVYVAYYPLDSITWSLGVVAAIDEIVAPAELMQQHILALTKEAGAGIGQTILTILAVVAGVLILAIPVTIFLAMRLSNSLTAPILSLSEGAKIISAGDLDHRLEV